jgi:hypothetical protein
MAILFVLFETLVNIIVCMNKKDEFWFWVINAITNTYTNEKKYFYDREMDTLLSLSIIENQETTPNLRNNFSYNNEKIIDSLSKLIVKINNKDASIIELPVLSIDEKRNFLLEYINAFDDENIKIKLLNEMKTITQITEFCKINLKSIDKNIHLDFDLQRGQFIANKIEEKYYL